MVADITTRADGTAEAAFAMQPAWHDLGVVDTDPDKLTSKEFFTAAQLDWKVKQQKMWVGDDSWTVVEAPDSLANVREDNGFILGYVSPHYKIVQNNEAFEFLDSLHEDRELDYESAFSLRGGKEVVVTARLPKVDEIVQGDELQRYVLMGLNHGGTAAIWFGVTSVRTVCSNTYALALAEGDCKELSIRHSGNVKDSLDRARAILNLANTMHDDHVEVCRGLAGINMSDEMWDKYLDIMCPRMPQEDPDWTPLRDRRVVETRTAIEECYHNERQTMPGVEGTAWAAFNAITEHIDHLPRRGATRAQKAEARFNVTQYGPGRDQKERAMQAILRLTLAS